MPFSQLEVAGIARSLSQIADRPTDLADAFFERDEIIEVPPAEETCGARWWRAEGFAVRLLRDSKAWLAARDGVDAPHFAEALRQVARVLPPASYSPPPMRVEAVEAEPVPDQLLEFPHAVTRAIRQRLAAFPLRLRVRRYRRWVRVVDPRMARDQESETYFSYEAETPWGRSGALLSTIDADAAERVAADLTLLFRTRDAPPTEAVDTPIVLGPAAAAVLLHEAVAHALEADTLALSGRLEAAIGVRIGSSLLDVLDTPADGPLGVRRTTDDEGAVVLRRWLLRGGVVEQPLADLGAAHGSAALVAGAGRRGDYHSAPVPRSSHLELLPGESSFEDLLDAAGDGYFFPLASRGSLDPMSGRFRLELAGGRRIRDGRLETAAGELRLAGTVSELLRAIRAVSRERRTAGAGWCAKGGVRLPVWATVPSVLLVPGGVSP